MENPVDETELLGLPAELDDIFIANERFFNTELTQSRKTMTHSFPTEFPYEFDSSPAFSSPVESVIGSAETESSDEEEFFAGLTQRLTQFSLGETHPKKTEKLMMSGSPQSTLTGLGSWSFKSGSSGNGSPNGIASPPMTPFSGEADTWDLIYQAAGQVARLKMSNEVPNNNNQVKGILGTPLNVGNHNNTNSLFANQGFTHNQYQGLRQEQLVKQQAVWGRQHVNNGDVWQTPLSQQHSQPKQHSHMPMHRSSSYGLSQSAWPPLQVRPQFKQPHRPEISSDSGMRAVFLQGSGVKRESAGTGVFLPRRYGTPPVEPPRKKLGCSTVLVPAKVVQALNLNLMDLNNGHHVNVQSRVNYDAVFARNAIIAQQKRKFNLCPEAALPQDWSY